MRHVRAAHIVLGKQQLLTHSDATLNHNWSKTPTRSVTGRHPKRSGRGRALDLLKQQRHRSNPTLCATPCVQK